MNENFNRARQLYDQGSVGHALKVCEQVLRLNPHHSDAWLLTAQIAIESGNFKLARLALKNVVELQPGNCVALANLASVLGELKEFEEAESILRTLLKSAADDVFLLSNLSNCRFEQGDFQNAEKFARQAQRLAPSAYWPNFHLANALVELAEFEDANRCFEKALSLQPGNVNARKNFALNLMRSGDFHRAGELYEARWQADGITHPQTIYGKPIWDGTASIQGKRLLLIGEQGLGDQLQFLRFGQLLRDRGAHVILRLHPAVLSIASSSDAFDELISLNDQVPRFDLQCPLMSLPRALNLTVETIPKATPYLRPDRLLVEGWRRRLPASSSLKVGICWKGNLSTKSGPYKSLDLKYFESLSCSPSVELICLQKDTSLDEIRQCGFELTHFAGELDATGPPFMDTAAILSCVDLVVTCDTSIAHLAAAMGVETWVLLRKVADWRWFLSPSDSPWYPSVRLFRQETAGDWGQVFDNVRHELAKLASRLP